MSLLFPELDVKETLKNVSDFLTNDLERLLLMSGRNLTDLKSPQLSFAPSHSTGNNVNEDNLIRGLDAGAMVDAVNDTIHHCTPVSELILIELFIKHKSWIQVQPMVYSEHTKFSQLRKRALLEFADSFDKWQRFHNCKPIIDLHAYE